MREHALPCCSEGDPRPSRAQRVTEPRVALTWLGDGRRQDDTVEPLRFLHVLRDLVNVDAGLLDL